MVLVSASTIRHSCSLNNDISNLSRSLSRFSSNLQEFMSLYTTFPLALESGTRKSTPASEATTVLKVLLPTNVISGKELLAPLKNFSLTS